MSTLGALFQAAAGPLAKRVMIALGFGVVTFAGLDAAVGAVFSQAKLAWLGVPADIQAFMAILGANTALAILAGAVTFRLGLIALKSFKLI